MVTANGVFASPDARTPARSRNTDELPETEFQRSRVQP